MLSMLWPEGLCVSVDIFENNSSKTLGAVLEEYSRKMPVDLNYYLEPSLGIPIVRNTALNVAKEARVSHIIFLDDDERVDPFWLINLWNYYLECDDRSVIQGAVISHIETKKNRHLHKHFQRPIRSTGDTLETCATNNVLVKLSVFFDHQLFFDETRPLAGGTDSKLFHKARELGVPLCYCAESIVYEDIPEERVNFKWLAHRNYRIGLTVGQRKRQEGEGIEYCLHHIRQALRILRRSTPSVIRRKRKKKHERWLLAMRCIGKAMGYYGVTTNSYKKIDGQ